MVHMHVGINTPLTSTPADATTGTSTPLNTEVNTPLNLAVIIGPIAAVGGVLLIILVVTLLTVVFL